MKFFRMLSMVAVLMTASTTMTSAAGELGLGDQGTEIAEIQSSLVQRGYDVSADGTYGAATADAIKSFQETIGINANGMVDSVTYKALFGYRYAGRFNSRHKLCESSSY